MIYAKDEAERFEIAEGSEILMDLAQVIKKFVNDETIVEYKSLTKKGENIARKDETVARSKEIAKNLLNDHLNIEKIMQYTGLSRQEILKLQGS